MVALEQNHGVLDCTGPLGRDVGEASRKVFEIEPIRMADAK